MTLAEELELVIRASFGYPIVEIGAVAAARIVHDKWVARGRKSEERDSYIQAGQEAMRRINKVGQTA